MLILEGVVTTLNADGTANISPMGPRVDSAMERFELRPFQTSTTYLNLKRTGEGVLHVSDDVELFALAAIGELDPIPKTIPAKMVSGVILEDACRWYAFRVRDLEDRDERTSISCQVVDQGRLRDFFGFNRAKHAVIEAAILATRVDFLPLEQIHGDFERLRVIVEKTAGDQEQRAFARLEQFVRRAAGESGE